MTLSKITISHLDCQNMLQCAQEEREQDNKGFELEWEWGGGKTLLGLKRVVGRYKQITFIVFGRPYY